MGSIESRTNGPGIQSQRIQPFIRHPTFWSLDGPWRKISFQSPVSIFTCILINRIEELWIYRKPLLMVACSIWWFWFDIKKSNYTLLAKTKRPNKSKTRQCKTKHGTTHVWGPNFSGSAKFKAELHMTGQKKRGPKTKSKPGSATLIKNHIMSGPQNSQPGSAR